MQGKRSPQVKRPQTATNKSAMNKTGPVGNGKREVEQLLRADDYQARGLTSAEVELEHLRTIVTELKRERSVFEALQADN